MSLTERIKEKSYELGFDLIGIAPAERALHAVAYHSWLAQGYAAGMSWMARSPTHREDPRQILPEAVSVVVVGLSYFLLNPPPELWNDPSRGRIARFAWGLDYHDIMLPRLRELGSFIEREAGSNIKQRAYVDTAPILERDVATHAGLGFVGKNSMLINPQNGSYLFLAEILVGTELEYDEPAFDEGASSYFKTASTIKRTASCGGCTRCLKACPAGAFPAPYVLDSRHCISYLTIEHKGIVPLLMRPLMGNWIFGCDECQEICPWVRRYSQPTRADFLSYDPEWAIPKLTDLMAMDDVAFRLRFKGSPIIRTKRRGFLRNTAIALGNWGSPEALPVLEQACYDPEPLIREHAAWAVEQIKSR